VSKPYAVMRGANHQQTLRPAWFARGLTAGRLSLAEHLPPLPLPGVDLRRSHGGDTRGKCSQAGPSMLFRVMARVTWTGPTTPALSARRTHTLARPAANWRSSVSAKWG